MWGIFLGTRGATQAAWAQCLQTDPPSPQTLLLINTSGQSDHTPVYARLHLAMVLLCNHTNDPPEEQSSQPSPGFRIIRPPGTTMTTESSSQPGRIPPQTAVLGFVPRALGSLASASHSFFPGKTLQVQVHTVFVSMGPRGTDRGRAWCSWAEHPSRGHRWELDGCFRRHGAHC